MNRILSGCAVVLAVCLSASAQEAARGDDCGLGNEGCGVRTSPESRAPSPDLESAPSITPNSELETRDSLIRITKFETPTPDPPSFGRPPAPSFEKRTGEEKPPPEGDVRREGFRWKAALEQSALLLAVQHGYALTQPKTRRELRGPFLKDYFRSVRNLHGWADGGRFFTNYVAHPLQGAATGFIQVQNDPKGMRQRFGGSGAYWRSRLKALAWSAASSTQFELGPISQASIGNVGKSRKLTYVDLVVTPTVGTALLVGEDALDRFVVRRIESASDNLYLRVAARMLLNPARSCANLLRFKKPWHRDTR
jgi:hypothetical protein